MHSLVCDFYNYICLLETMYAKNPGNDIVGYE